MAQICHVTCFCPLCFSAFGQRGIAFFLSSFSFAVREKKGEKTPCALSLVEGEAFFHPWLIRIQRAFHF